MLKRNNFYKRAKLLITIACVVLITIFLLLYANSGEKPDKVEGKSSGNTKGKSETLDDKSKYILEFDSAPSVVDDSDDELSTTITIKWLTPPLTVDWENLPDQGTILSEEPDSPKT